MTLLRFFAILMLIVGVSCNSGEKTEELNRREVQLAERERQLIQREQQLLTREEELAGRLRALDTLKVNSVDSAGIDSFVNAQRPEIPGGWNATMTCVETSCAGSAIGDTKTEVWQFRYEGELVVAEAFANNRLERVYNGRLVGNNLELAARQDSSVPQTETRIIVRLLLADKKSMQGQREIVRQNDCRILYSISLSKQ